MARANKQEELMNTTYVVVAENGIDTFSMKTVTTRLGVSEGLIYKYFDTREGLLLKSFVAFEKQIGEVLNELTEKEIEGETKETRRERIWKGYYQFFLDNNYKSLFYFEYRWSYRYADYKKLMEKEPLKTNYMDGIRGVCEAFLGKAAETEDEKDDMRWIVENTGLYVKKALLGDIENSEIMTHKIYQRIFFGVGALSE